MKIFITGEKGIGKSFCIQKMSKECHMKTAGFVTLPFYEKKKRKGFYLHSLLSVENNDIPFSIQHQECNECIPNVFNEFGVFLLEESRKYQNHVIIMDEIGHLEKEESLYIETLLSCIKSHPYILGVLKKSNQEYITCIKAMEDVLVLDMDVMKRKEVEARIRLEWEKNNA